MEQLLRHIAASLRLTEEPTDAAPGAGGDPDDGTDLDDTAWENTDSAAAPTTSGPGIERGFATFVRKHFQPDPGED